MSKKMPKLEAGMVFVFKWASNTARKYLYLGDEKTIDLEYRDVGSGPLIGDNDGESWGHITKVYQFVAEVSFDDYRDLVGCDLIWKKNTKSPEVIKIEELEKTIKEASAQIGELKKVYNES